MGGRHPRIVFEEWPQEQRGGRLPAGLCGLGGQIWWALMALMLVLGPHTVEVACGAGPWEVTDAETEVSGMYRHPS